VGPDSSERGYGRRRGFGRAAFLLVLASVLAAAGGSGCGGSGHGAETDPEKGADAALLNDALSRELTIFDAYTRGRGLLPNAQRRLGRQLRAHEQEYVDALTKAIRGLGGDTEAEAEELDLGQVKDRRAFLSLLYELESGALAFYGEAAARLHTAAPRTLDAALAAGHAQHLVVLREALGASALESVPAGFDGGEVPPPGRGPAGEG
jgi:hypothetical protein